MPRDPRELVRFVKSLNLPLAKYCLVGGGMLEVLGLREVTHDVDLLVTPILYNTLTTDGWKPKEYTHEEMITEHPYPFPPITHPSISFNGIHIEALTVQGFKTNPTASTLLEYIERAEIFMGVKVIQAGDMLEWKRLILGKGREQDKIDVKLLEMYLNE